MKNQRAKNYAALTVLICAVLPLLACGSTGTIIYDNSLPPEKTVLIVFEETIHVLEYNGIAVEDTWYPKKEWRTNKVTLPAGETLIVFDYSIQDNKYSLLLNSHYKLKFVGEDIEMRFNFEAGQEYTVGAYIKSLQPLLGVLGKFECGVEIRGVDGEILKSWKLGEIDTNPFS